MPAKKSKTPAIKENSLAGILAGMSGRWLSEDEKEELSDEKVPFYVTGIELTTDKKYGKRWELSIIVDGEERGLTIPAHKSRDEAMEALAALAKSESRIGPLRLKVKPFGDDRTWISLHAVRQQKG